MRVVLIGIILILLYSCTYLKKDNFYEDKIHFSKVFKQKKYYRIYFPVGYGQPDEKYPVIYFFHGWGGRHFKDDNAKLRWPISLDGKKKRQETYKILGVFDASAAE